MTHAIDRTFLALTAFVASMTIISWASGPLGIAGPKAAIALLAIAATSALVLAGWALVRLRRQERPTVARTAAAVAALALVASLGFGYEVLANRDEELTPDNVSPTSDPSPPSLRLVSFNVLHGYPDFADQESRFKDTLAAFQALGPDIVVLQEAWNTSEHGHLAERLARQLQMNFVYARANGSCRRIGFEEGAAVLSRYPIRKARRQLLAPRQPWWEHRIALVAELDIGGKSLSVVGVHLAHRDANTTTAQAKTLLSKLAASGPHVVAGDFNARSDSAALKQFVDAKFTDLLPGDIDHVLTPNDLARYGWRVDRSSWTLRPDDLNELIGTRTAISDHPGIVVDFLAVE